MPISACIGRAEIMDAWPASTGEALHTQTFLGHPAGCAAALASLDVLERDALPERARQLGAETLAWLRAETRALDAVREVRGRGLMLGIECHEPERALDACASALARGVILLPSGDGGRVLSVTPPLTIEHGALQDALALALDGLA